MLIGAHRIATSLAFALIVAGCTKVLGIDGNYVQTELDESGGAGTGGAGGSANAAGSGDSPAAGGSAESGGFASGGAPSGGVATGGGPDTGGTTGNTGGSSGAGGADDGGHDGLCGQVDAMVCSSDEKCCSGTCTKPSPLVGCSLTGCDRCPQPPDNAVAACISDQCDIDCNMGYTKVGTGVGATCEPASTGSGGTGGKPSTGGTGGIVKPPSCNLTSCPTCGVFGPFACCLNNGQCGCTWAPIGGYCLPN